MSWDDRRLARAMRAIDPARTPMDEGLSQEAQHVLDDIMTGRRTPVEGGWMARRRRLWLPMASAALLFVALIVVLPIVTTQAVAITPRSLTFQADSSLSLQEVMETSATTLTSGASAINAKRGSHSVGWYLDATITDRDSTAVIVPQVTTISWDAELAGSARILAGHAYLAGDSPSNLEPPEGAPTPGKVLSEMTFAAGEYQPLEPNEPGTSPADLRSFLQSYGLPDAYTAGDLMLAVGGAFGEWTLSNAHQASILTLLAMAPGAEVLGTGFDRVGREVVGIRGVPSQVDGSEQLLLIAVDTGRIVGAETVLTRSIAEPPLREGAVISYTLWDLNEGDADK